MVTKDKQDAILHGGGIMSMIPCNCNCEYQTEGYCTLDKAAQVTNGKERQGCLHFVEREIKLHAKQPRKLP